MQPREYVSPDGLLKFLVICPDGDLTMGFDGCPWHTHGSTLADLSGLSETEATERLVTDLITSVSVITVQRIGGKITDAWISADPAGDLAGYRQYGELTETIEFRRWDGTQVEVRTDHAS
ncbi:hypothetical protein LQG66_25140 [Bradyrhizobium ontarionense]|uniref:Uncharacterized protein n=1 Tax=Bradyrhizobium ontarionense TaxID=2898149 RepID=A0ABY3R715_9BRAD|nr:hypothetical protein [Bradyrhizobium sp. A19]UFZ02553.1 hypothetical protein LQG66_25140 [Bradyrhizobium sp. A19]